MLNTEKRNENTMHIDKMSTLDMLKAMQKENLNAVNAVEAAIPDIEKAVDAAVDSLKKGGRIIYIGAGTSGRLGVVDASECPPTFGVSPDTVVGVIAGGRDAMFRSSENKEDSGESGIADVKNINLNKNDIIIGISAAGGAEYVIKALEYAKSLGCVTVGITSNKGTMLDIVADISIVTDTGAEVITGSTRMKAGTAQKLILNMISTSVMIKMGYVYENLMINLKPSNSKLKKRIVRIVSSILDVDENEAVNLLEQVNYDIKEAINLYKGE